MNEERGWTIGLAVLRGAALVALFAVWLAWDASFTSPRAWSILGATLCAGFAAGLRAARVGCSVLGTAVIWASVALIALTVPVALQWGSLMNQLYWYPSSIYAYVVAMSVIVGLLELACEVARPTWRAARVGAAIGAALCFAYALVAVSACVFFTPERITVLGRNDFDAGLRDAARGIASVMTLGGALIGWVTVALATASRRGDRLLDAARAVPIVTFLWVGAPLLLVCSLHLRYGVRYPEPLPLRVEKIATGLLCSSAETEGAKTGFGTWMSPSEVHSHPWLSESPTCMAALALAGVLGGLLFASLAAWRLRKQPFGQAPVTVASRRALILFTLAAAVSVAWQSVAVAAPPLDRLRAGLAHIEPLGGAGPYDLVGRCEGLMGLAFSPDSGTLWIAKEDGETFESWQVRPTSAPARKPPHGPWRYRAVSPDARLGAAIDGGTVQLQDRASGAIIAVRYSFFRGKCTAVVTASGRCSGDVHQLVIVDGARVLPVLPDSPVVMSPDEPLVP